MAEYTSTTSMPAWAQPYAEGYLQRAQTVAEQPYQQYQGQRVAGFTPWQQQGLQAQAQRAADGSPLMNSASGALQQMYGGQQQGAAYNPYGQVQAGWNGAQVQPGQGGAAVQAGWNGSYVQPGQGGSAVQAGWNGMQVQAPTGTEPIGMNTSNNMQVQPGQNALAGVNNPYLNSQIDQAQGDVVRNWANVQAPSFDTAMSRSGGYGNANITSMAQQGMTDLQRSMGDISSRMRFQDYSQQQQLAENAVNRGMQAQQFNAGLQDNNIARALGLAQFNAGLSEAGANRSMQAQQFNAGLNSENIGRQLQAGQFNAGLGEAAAGRGMQAQQFNAGLNNENLARQFQAGQFNAGLGESAAARGMQAQQFNAGLTSENLARQLQAGQFNANMGEQFAGRQDSMFNSGQQRILAALGMAPQYAQQDYNDIDRLQQAGTAYQGQQQREMDANYQTFQESRDYPVRQLDIFGSALGRAVGNSNTTTQSQPDPSALGSAVGGALTFAQLMKLIGG